MQHILVFQQHGSGEKKIKGIREHGREVIRLEVVSIDVFLPAIIDDPEAYIPKSIQADLVLDYLRHPDLSQELCIRCSDLGIPVVASGKKWRIEGVFIPPTCCGLPRNERLGAYGEMFGAPELTVRLKNGMIDQVQVVRSAPCGATWDAAARVLGWPFGDATVRIGLETQFFCFADPAGWDPMYGKSPVHFAGEVHKAALRRAGENTEEDDSDQSESLSAPGGMS
jgi:thymidylate synthase